MANGIFVDGNRPKSKKAIKEAVADDPNRVTIERTALGREGYVKLPDASDDDIGPLNPFVGPDPYRSRKWYGQIIRQADDTFKVK